MSKLSTLTDQELRSLADVIGPALAAGVKVAVDHRLDQRLELERSFTREVIRAEIEPLRQREKRQAEKLAAIEQALASRPRKAA